MIYDILENVNAVPCWWIPKRFHVSFCLPRNMSGWGGSLYCQAAVLLEQSWRSGHLANNMWPCHPFDSGQANSLWSMTCLGFQQANETGEGKVHWNAVWIEANKMQLTVFLCLKGLLYWPSTSPEYDSFFDVSCFSQLLILAAEWFVTHLMFPASVTNLMKEPWLTQSLCPQCLSTIRPTSPQHVLLSLPPQDSRGRAQVHKMSRQRQVDGGTIWVELCTWGQCFFFTWSRIRILSIHNYWCMLDLLMFIHVPRN